MRSQYDQMKQTYFQTSLSFHTASAAQAAEAKNIHFQKQTTSSSVSQLCLQIRHKHTYTQRNSKKQSPHSLETTKLRLIIFTVQ